MDDPEYVQLTLFDDPETGAVRAEQGGAAGPGCRKSPARSSGRRRRSGPGTPIPQPRMFPVAVTFLVPEQTGLIAEAPVCRRCNPSRSRKSWTIPIAGCGGGTQPQ